MADPTFAEVITQLTHSIHWLQELDELCNADGTNLNGLEDTLVAALEGEYVGNALRALQDDRAKKQ